MTDYKVYICTFVMQISVSNMDNMWLIYFQHETVVVFYNQLALDVSIVH